MKTNKRKVRKSLRCVKEFSRRFDLTNGIFARGFARTVKVTDFAQVINFREKAHRKIHPQKEDKSNRESMNLLLFSTQQQNKVYCPFFNTTPKTKSFLSFLFCILCFSFFRIFRCNCTRGELREIK